MRKTNLMNSVTRGLHRAGFTVKKHSPEILLGVGIVTGVATLVTACKATTKVSAVLEKTKKTVDDIHYVLDNQEEYGDQYTPEDGKKDLAIAYVQTGYEFAKLYAPAVILGVTSLTCILASHNIIHKRNIALAAAYATVDNSFKEYRNRVIDRFGKELDRELKYNIKAQEIEETVINEDGTETVVKKTVQTVHPNDISEFARFFDETCTAWDRNAEYNLMFLKRTQDHFNDLLRTRGHVFLNEVYDALGMQRSTAGQIVGWVYDESNPDCDNYIDFGIFDLYNESKRHFVNGFEKSILLDFNVDGNIVNLIN